MPRHNKRSQCVRESILLPNGGVDTILLDERYTPYTRQPTRIENLCGSFTEFVSTTGLEQVLRRSGLQRELFHVHGNVVVNQGKGAFMAVRGADGLAGLARALRLSGPGNVVHMAVLTSKMGVRAQVSAGGLLEASLARHRDMVRVKGRIYEHTNSVCFAVRRFDQAPFELPAAVRPDNNDWTVTGKGMIIIRLIWHHLEWNAAVEEACLGLCDRVTAWLQGCCE
jgi:hypothetical protein